MDKQKQERLAAEGWKLGSVAEFLDLTSEEAEIVEQELSESLADDHADDGIITA